MAKQELDLVNEVKDPAARENFDRITNFVLSDLFLKFDGSLFTYSFTSAVTNFKFPHGLRFVPKDTWLTYKSTSATVTFNYQNFSTTEIDITTSGSVLIRFIAGQFREYATQ